MNNNKLDVENMDHTEWYIKKLSELNGLELGELSSGLFIVLKMQHDIAIRLHERLTMARRTIERLEAENEG